MLFSVSTLKGYAIEAEDGKVGEIEDMLFDDRSWRARWLVVDTGSWLSGRSVLIHPSAVIGRNSRCQELAIRLTKARIPASPDIGLHRPVSRQIEAALHDYYGSDPTWGGSILGAGAMTEAFRPSPVLRQAQPLRPAWPAPIWMKAIHICVA